MPDIKAIIGEPFRRGVFPGMPETEYRAANGINPSAIAEGISNEFSPLYVRHSYETPSEPTAAMELGTFGHCMLLEPTKLDERYAICDTHSRATKEWKECVANNPDCTVLKASDVDKYTAAIDHALSHQQVRDLIGNGISEVSVFSHERGMQTKGRLDWVNTDTGTPIDIKFTGDVRPMKFGRVASSLAYVPKLACYHRWFSREHGIKLRPFVMLAIQVHDRRPNDFCIVPVTEADLDHGWQRADRMLGTLRDAIDSDSWPGVAGESGESPLWVPAYDIPEECDEVAFND